MPNWCTNKLRVTIDHYADEPAALAQLADFTARLKAGVTDGTSDDQTGWKAPCLHLLDTFVPMPEKYVDTVSGNPPKVADDGLYWYKWQHDNWSVKWGDCAGEIIAADELSTELLFTTPWGPPTKALVAISAQFPLLDFFNDWDEESPAKGYQRLAAGDLTESVAAYPS